MDIESKLERDIQICKFGEVLNDTLKDKVSHPHLK